MKTHIRLAILTGLAAIFFVSSPAFAVPSLQLDIVNGVYDETTETIVATESSFTLLALLRPNDANKIAERYYISAALVPKTSPSEEVGSLGSFTFARDGGEYGVTQGTVIDVRNGITTTINVTADMTYGRPPIERYLGGISTGDPRDLPKHDIFETFFSEFSFFFDLDATLPSYNTQTGAPASGLLNYAAFSIDISNLNPDYAIHFDLYNEYVKRCTTGDIDIEGFAPFSHDAESGKVPEPGTALLLGSGLIGLVSFRRLKRS